MVQVRHHLLPLVLALAAGGASAADGMFSFSGFGTLGLVRTSTDDAQYANFGQLRGAGILGDHGRILALGTPTELKQKMADRVLLEVRTDAPGPALKALSALEPMAEVSVFGAGIHALAKPGTPEPVAIRAVTEALRHANISASDPVRVPPTLEDVFLQWVQEAAS